MYIDATTVLASIACLSVFIGWLVLPHRAVSFAASQPEHEHEREGVTTAA